MEEERKKVLYLQLINKRRKLADLREQIMCKKGLQDAIPASCNLDNLNTDGELMSVQIYQEHANNEDNANSFAELNDDIKVSNSGGHDVNMNISKDPEKKILDYDSDDSVKDKTYDPSKDFLDDDSSDSPDHDILLSRKNLVKKQLFAPNNNSPQKHSIDDDLITLSDLINVNNEDYQEPSTSYDIIKFENQIEIAEQMVPRDFSQDIINNTSEEHPNNVNTDTLTTMNERIPLATNNIPPENCENIRHHGSIMVVIYSNIRGRRIN